MTDNIRKLPKWAQQHIQDLERRADSAEKRLCKYLDQQTESPFFTEDHVNSQRRFLQTNSVYVRNNGIELHVLLPRGVQGREGIELTWHVERRGRYEDAALLPRASNSVTLDRVNILSEAREGES